MGIFNFYSAVGDKEMNQNFFVEKPLLSGFSEIKCNQCGTLFKIAAEDLDVDQTSADERQMGTELLYTGQIDLECPTCNTEIELSYEASEYPLGVPNFSETHSKGAEVITAFPDINVHFDKEND